MPRSVDGSKRKNRRSKILAFTKGFWGRRKNLYRTARNAMIKSLKYSYRDRRNKKREFRALWITRISIACKEHGLNYSTFIALLEKNNCTLNRKIISNLVVEDEGFLQALLKELK